jgi:hypothetical protein
MRYQNGPTGGATLALQPLGGIKAEEALLALADNPQQRGSLIVRSAPLMRAYG